jgi:hypothetical protein
MYITGQESKKKGPPRGYTPMTQGLPPRPYLLKVPQPPDSIVLVTKSVTPGILRDIRPATELTEGLPE